MAASVCRPRKEAIQRYLVYFLICILVQLRTAAAEYLKNEDIFVSLNSQELNQFSLFYPGSETNSDSCNVSTHLQKFSNASANFILCSSTTAKPVTFCENCSSQYQGVLAVVKQIENDTDCRDKILNSDILQIVKKTQKFVEDLWNDGNCENCFNPHQTSQKGSPKYEFSNKTKQFLELYGKTEECFQNHSSSEIQDHDGYFLEKSQVCYECNGTYHDLNKLYEHMGSSEDICIDIVEMMNMTRRHWNEYNCTIHQTNYTAVVSISIMCCCLPVVFYLFAMFLTRKKVIRGTDLSTSMKGNRDIAGAFGPNRR